MSNSINQSTMTLDEFFDAMVEYKNLPVNAESIEKMEQLLQKTNEVIGTLKQALSASKED